MNLPLEGIRVLDLSRYLPGPFATQMLADFGAEVIKVEDPKGGDLGRMLPPLIAGESARFFTVNRNKKSITLDLKKAEGQEVFKRLAANSDVVVDQFRPGVMEKMGLGYEQLKAVNPGIIYCALTGYGLDGPLRDAAGHDLNYLNLAGITGVTGVYQSKPAISGTQIADIAGGTLHSVIGILLALAARQKTGQGQICDVAMMDASVSLMAYTLGEWSGQGTLPVLGDDLLTGGYAFYQIYTTKDGKYVSLGAVEDKFYAEFCRKINRPDLIEKQFKKASQRQIIAEISEIMLERTRDEWVEFFADSDICFTPVLELDEVCQHPQVKARNMIIEMENFSNTDKTVRLTGIPIKLSETPGQIKLKFPILGEHNDEVLMSVGGFTQEEVKNLRAEKVI
ncbi:MAG TPA: CoA transferase [Syntrophomonas sp.]|jgi:crotonobetainyl-CoA:carnitine CoA-transferase CaiB-like acyl-CoA transferase|nr:CoA transferase [Syntrophomonas sp.]